ncbi:MAG: hypothetical protein QGH70_10250 [Nitrospinota bacterium]|nr:hypothetical protein [Nitrospinota bacterium]
MPLGNRKAVAQGAGGPGMNVRVHQPRQDNPPASIKNLVGVRVAAGADEATVRSQAEADAGVAKQIAGKQVERVIYVPGRLLNFVVK